MRYHIRSKEKAIVNSDECLDEADYTAEHRKDQNGLEFSDGSITVDGNTCK